MIPEYVDVSDLIQPDTRSNAQKWLDAEMDKRGANEHGAEPYLILEAIALEVIEENQRLRAQIVQGEPVVPVNCRQRLKSEGKAYAKSNCASCGELSPKWKECDAMLASARPAPQQIDERKAA